VDTGEDSGVDVCVLVLVKRSNEGVQEKRKLLNFVCSSSVWRHGALLPDYRKPFDLIVEAQELQDKRAVETGEELDETAQNEIWLPFLDDYRTFVSLEPKRVTELVELLAA